VKTTNSQIFVFVLMPFGEAFNAIYKDGIKAACKEAGVSCERVDEQKFDGRILDRIYSQIAKADIIVADMTGRNPNVFYEVGYAHAIHKRVILLTQNVEDIPFDLTDYQHIVYEGNIQSLKSELTDKIKWCIEHPKDSTRNVKNPQALAYLREMIELHGKLAKKTHFLIANNPILEYLIKYYMENYVSVLKQAYHFQALPLPSEPRMEAAMQAISNSEHSVCAVSILKNDEWHKEGEKTRYTKVNIDAAQRGLPVQRVFVAEKESDLSRLESLIKLKKEAGIELRYAVRKNLVKTLNNHIGGAFTLVNILICDRKMLTLSTHLSKHDGSIVLNPNKIAQYEDRFRFIWDFSQPL
jgi:hypothetical protein